MSRKKTKTTSAEESLLDEIEKPLEIKEAAIKDDYCNYSYELLRGVGEGDTISRKGAAIIHDDMKEAFEALNVHLAIVDDAFKYSKIEIGNIDEVINHPLTGQFNVSGFKIKGNTENRSVILVGTKFIGVGGYISLETPRIKFDGNYQFKDDLYAAVEKCCYEVEQYMNGKAAPAFEQTEMNFDTNVTEKEFSEAAL